MHDEFIREPASQQGQCADGASKGTQDPSECTRSGRKLCAVSGPGSLPQRLCVGFEILPPTAGDLLRERVHGTRFLPHADTS